MAAGLRRKEQTHDVNEEVEMIHVCDAEDAILGYLRRRADRFGIAEATASLTGELRPAADQLTAQGVLKEVRLGGRYSHHALAHHWREVARELYKEAALTA